MAEFDLKDIATVSSKPGLYKVLKPTRNGVIIESMDKDKRRMMIQTRHKISLLHEISIFTLDEEGSVPLETVYSDIFKKYGEDVPVTAEDGENELRDFLSGVLPQYDEERVYLSDLKKLVSWYDLVIKFAPPKVEKKTESKKSATAKQGGSKTGKKDTEKTTSAKKTQKETSKK